MVVGELPDKYEDEQEQSFAGPGGALTYSMLDTAGVRKSECYFTNVIKRRPAVLAGKKKYVASEEDIKQLWEEVWAIKPNCVLALGEIALKALTGKRGIKKWRGSILPSIHHFPKVVGTFHPGNLLRTQGTGSPFKYSARVYMQLDFNRAVAQSKFPAYEPPKRQLEIGRSSSELWRFLETYQDRKSVSVDIEVIRAVPVCIALAFNSHHAMSVPLLDIRHLQGRGDPIPKHELARIWIMLAEFFARPDIRIIGQNFKFDQSKLLKCCGFKCANVYLDNMLLAHSIYPELDKSQGFLASIYTEEPYYKDDGKEFNWTRDDFDQFQVYNARDAVVAYEIATEQIKEAKEIKVPGVENWYQEFFLDYVMKLNGLYMDIEDVGLLTDVGRKKDLLKTYKEQIAFHQERLNTLAGFEVNVNSTRHVAILLYKEFKLPQRADVKKETLVALEANTAKNPLHKEAINLILLLRGMRKAVTTYFSAKLDYDGRMRTGYKITGADTGRSSTEQLEPPVRPEKIGLAFQTMTKHGDVGAELREMFVPDPGHVFMDIDLSQAEARIVALLGRSQETLDLFEKADIHSVTSSWIFGIKPERITSDQRFVGKSTRHAGNYDMGKHRLMLIVNTNAKRFHIPINISEWRAGKILDTFHEMSPWIRGVFHEEVVEHLIENECVLVNPFGRRHQFLERWDDELKRKAYNFIPQSTVADHLKKALLRIKARIPWLRIAIEAHDAILAIVPFAQVDTVATVVKEEFEVPIDFKNCSLSRGSLIIPADIKVGEINYRALSKYKKAA
jgi:uracil-DNA glycosylase family 4